MNRVGRTRGTSGFTIVELLVIIVVIGILVGITAISYRSYQTQSAQSVLETDLNRASAELERYRADRGGYPLTANVSAVNNGQGLSQSEGTTLQYTSNGSTFCIMAVADRQGVSAMFIRSGNDSIQTGTC